MSLFLPDFGFLSPSPVNLVTNPANQSASNIGFGDWIFGGSPSNVFLPGRDNMADVAAGASGAAQGALAGGSIGGPIGAGIGAVGGFLAGLFGKPTSTGKPAAGLLDGLSLGLASLGGGGGAPPVYVNQSQQVNQETGVNVTNVLGGQPFGGVDASGNFDVFQALSDVFALKNALNAQNQTVSGGVSQIPQQAGPNLLPVYLAVGGVLLILLLKGK